MNNVQLIEAVKRGDIESVKDLIAAGEDINQRDEYGWTPLNWASGKGSLDLVTLLVEKGADVFAVGRDQRTPYLIALAAGHVEVVLFLREAEAKTGKAVPRPPRKYCKAYYLQDLRQFPEFVETRKNWKPSNDGSKDVNSESREFTDDDVVFIHQDFTVTQSMWHNENIIFDQVTPEWEDFCSRTLKFRVPDDLDLIGSAKAVGKTPS
jgi:ankyrin repeat protein